MSVMLSILGVALFSRPPVLATIPELDENVESTISRILAEAPPLEPAQRSRLTALLQPSLAGVH